MTRTKIFLLLLILAPIRMASTAGKDCPGVPRLGAVEACRKASGTELIYDLCIRTMREGGVDMSPSHEEEVTAYAILASQYAMKSYDRTQVATSTQLDQKLPGPVKEAYEGCLTNDYPSAEDSLERAKKQMQSGCDFAWLADKFTSGMMSLDGCRDRLVALKYSTPVSPMVLVDRESVSLAYMLAKLLGI